MSDFHYGGEELDVFEGAYNWKAYWLKKIEPFIGSRILEVGAGIGATTAALKHHSYDEWLCIEPDKNLCKKIKDKQSALKINKDVEVKSCTTSELEGQRSFDTILYIDVLEHIEKDIQELEVASGLLNRDGKIIILAPAHNFLYSPFDRKIGHYRRYNKASLSQLVPKKMKIQNIQYMDSIGLFASLANKLILKKSDPSKAQVAFWDKIIVPISKIVDPVLLNSVGKSILAVFRK
jgi:phospholipid N-methyltransferase